MPADAVLGVARELLQARIPVVECACFETRFELAAFSARVMLDAARKLPAMRRGARRYALGL